MGGCWRLTEVYYQIPVPFPPLMYKESTLTSSCAYNEKDFAEVVKAFAEGKFILNRPRQIFISSHS